MTYIYIKKEINVNIKMIFLIEMVLIDFNYLLRNLLLRSKFQRVRERERKRKWENERVESIWVVIGSRKTTSSIYL